MNKPQPQTGPEIEEYSTTATPKAYAGSVPVFCAHDAIVPLKDLRPNPKNPNQHPPEQIKLLASIIRATGWRAPITVSKRSGLVTKGHGRLMAAQLDDLTDAPVDYQDYASEAEELADLPLVDSTAQAVDTITKAIAWKKANAFTGERSKVYWPQAVDNLGNVFHLSTLAVVELMRADFSHNSVPMETCGNKAIPVIKQYFGANAKNRGFDQQSGKELTQNGISTAVAWGGEWVLWGDHTAAYTYGADVDPRAIFDVSMRMLMHITNDFQREWSPEIDEPMTRALKDRIINREQEKLDGYVSMGALLGSPVILFLESENSTTDVMNGDFRWDIAVTPTPPLKSASVYVAYTDAGFSVYYEGGDE